MTWLHRSLGCWRAWFPLIGLLLAVRPQLAAADLDPCAPFSSNPQEFLGCKLGQGAASAPGAAVSFGADQAERALTQWVVDTATWVLNQLVDVIFTNSSPVLSADWFRAHYADMVAVAWVVAPLFLILGVIQAVIRADLGLPGRMAVQL